MIILTTTHEVDGKKIIEYKGLVTGEVIAGVNVVRDLFASVRDFFGGHSEAYEKELGKAREEAMREMQERAEAMGANAVVAIDIDYESLSNSGMLIVSVTGTAVMLE